MPNYKEMYLDLMRTAETAINLIIDAQRRCEELYINGDKDTVVQISRATDDE